VNRGTYCASYGMRRTVYGLDGCQRADRVFVERGRDAQREDVRPACSSPKPVSAGFRICKFLAVDRVTESESKGFRKGI
jgi:hypothetical protein